MTLHLIRRAEPPAGVVADRDWVVYLKPLRLAAHGQPPRPPSLIDHDALLALCFAADRVITW